MKRIESNEKTRMIVRERTIEEGTVEEVGINLLGTIATILTDMSISWAGAADSMREIADSLKKEKEGGDDERNI